ncbi:MAG: MarC family NAAT transporter [Nonlabens sp.]|nr:MarC family NAAT transporter [Nonlabens sp.]MDP5101510.1 MarC family NAAT transporter [Nonlabens sp.]
MLDIFLLSFGSLFSITNPLGTVPIFVGLTSDDNSAEQTKTALLTGLNVGVILVVSFFAGKYILSFFGISLDSLRIAGGMIIVSSGFALLTGKFTKHKGMDKRVKDDAFNRESISLTPLAMPMIAGPGSISLLISLEQEVKTTASQSMVLLAILATAISICLILGSSRFIVRFLGASGINAVSRLVGFIVIAIGIEYVSSSIVNVVRTISF